VNSCGLKNHEQAKSNVERTRGPTFKAQALKPEITKLADGVELLSFANGDEFTGETHRPTVP